MSTIYIIGIGGRTGAMFAREMQSSARIIGVGRLRDAETIRTGRINLQRNGAAYESLSVPVILPEDFGQSIIENPPDYIWISVRNPVEDSVEYYYRNFAGMANVPTLILSQNGLSAVADAKAGLVRSLGRNANAVKIIRVSLINGIDLKVEDEVSVQSRSFVVGYKLPIKLGFCDLSSNADSGLNEIFSNAGIAYKDFGSSHVFDMECSKLFTNLIGMAAAVNGFDVNAGLRDKSVFREEIQALKEFVSVVKKSGGSFLSDFCGYPVNMFAKVITLPTWLLIPFRGIFASVVAKGRNRPKDLSEVEYYNGEVVQLGKKYNFATPMNECIVVKAKKPLKR